MKLLNHTKNSLIVENLVVADNMWLRAKGLLGKSSLSNNEAMLFRRCNSVHTFFMQMHIDVIFIDHRGFVKALFENVKPWKFIFPVWKAKDTVEASAGTIQRKHIQIGDELHVVS